MKFKKMLLWTLTFFSILFYTTEATILKIGRGLLKCISLQANPNTFFDFGSKNWENLQFMYSRFWERKKALQFTLHSSPTTFSKTTKLNSILIGSFAKGSSKVGNSNVISDWPRYLVQRSKFSALSIKALLIKKATHQV